MNKSDFLRELECQLDVAQNSLNESRALEDIESWDSMASIMFIALADQQLGVNVSGRQIANSKTVGDLLRLLGDRLAA